MILYGQKNPWPVFKNEENVVPHPPLRKEGEDGNEQQGAGEGPLQQRGESAVFKKGILGNYEPKEPPKSFKPGMHSHCDPFT